MMMTELKDASTGDVCLRMIHPTGLEIRVMKMPDFSTAYAQFGVKFGSVYRKYRQGRRSSP